MYQIGLRGFWYPKGIGERQQCVSGLMMGAMISWSSKRHDIRAL
jgi:hypothetical protein